MLLWQGSILDSSPLQSLSKSSLKQHKNICRVFFSSFLPAFCKLLSFFFFPVDTCKREWLDNYHSKIVSWIVDSNICHIQLSSISWSANSSGGCFSCIRSLVLNAPQLHPTYLKDFSKSQFYEHWSSFRQRQLFSTATFQHRKVGGKMNFLWDHIQSLEHTSSCPVTQRNGSPLEYEVRTTWYQGYYFF